MNPAWRLFNIFSTPAPPPAVDAYLEAERSLLANCLEIDHILLDEIERLKRELAIQRVYVARIQEFLRGPTGRAFLDALRRTAPEDQFLAVLKLQAIADWPPCGASHRITASGEPVAELTSGWYKGEELVVVFSSHGPPWIMARKGLEALPKRESAT